MLSGVENLPFRQRKCKDDCATPLADSFVQCRICTLGAPQEDMRRILLTHQKQESRTRLVCKQSLDEQSEKENASCGMFVKFRLPRSRDNEAMIHATWARNRHAPQIGPILFSDNPTWILAAERAGVSHATGTVGMFHPWMRAAGCFFRLIMLAQIGSKSRFQMTK